MSGLKTFNEEFKRKVVYEVKMGFISKEEARRTYNIAGHSTVLKWIRKFEGKDPFNLRAMPQNKSSNDDLLKRIKELEHQLEDETLRSEGLSKMIDIAEDQLNISIRKKSDTKQSKK